ncbi:MAG: DUF4367 domain-containing protein [Clostridia bacterium]|nr:DUF4367 domain-containing protein [Clostridia bacterium]
MKTNWFKHPKLYEAFDLYCQQCCDELPPKDALAAISISPTLENKMRRLLRRQKYGYYAMFGTVGRRVASIVVALLVGAIITTFSVKALREPVVRFFTEVFERFTSVLFTNDEPSLNFEATEPAYIPEGYVVEQQFSDDTTIHRIHYYNAQSNMYIRYMQSWNSAGSLGMNTEGVEYHTVDINGLEGIAYAQNGSTAVMFVYDHYTFTVKGSLTEEEMLRIAASIPLS